MNDIKTGFLPDEIDERDLVFGSDNSLATKLKGREILAPDSDWSRWLPVTEPQSNTITESNGCVSFGTNNIIEILKKWLHDTDINLSDRFLTKTSGTIPTQGNNPRKVADSLKKNWSVFENEWPFTSEMSVAEFYKDIPQNLIILATGRGAEYEFGYEPRVNYKDIREALKYSPLGVSVPAWWKDETNRYYRPEGQWDTHWTVCFSIQPNGDLLIFDSYYPYIKTLRADVVPRTIYSYYLQRHIVREDFWQKFIQWLNQTFGKYVFGNR